MAPSVQQGPRRSPSEGTDAALKSTESTRRNGMDLQKQLNDLNRDHPVLLTGNGPWFCLPPDLIAGLGTGRPPRYLSGLKRGDGEDRDR